MTVRRSACAVALTITALTLVACSSSPPVRLEPVSQPAVEVPLPGATAPAPEVAPTPGATATPEATPAPDAVPTPSPTSAFSAEELERIDAVSAAGYWDVHDGTTWQYRITTSTGFEVDATRTSRVEAVRDDAVDISITQEYRFADGSFDPVTIVSDGRADADGGYRESLQLAFNQAWRQAPDPVFDADFTLPAASQLQDVGPQTEPIDIGPLGTGPYEEYERSTRTIRSVGAGAQDVLGTLRDVVCFTELRGGDIEGPDGSLTPFERRADLCFLQGLGLVSSRVVAGDAWEEWALVATTAEAG